MGEGISRRIIRAAGVVQGVGFRPFIYRLARRHGLRGRVLNTSGTVEIDVEGPDESIEAFTASIRSEAPALARVESVASIEADPVGYTSFEVAHSRVEESAEGVIPADVAACSDCLSEIGDPRDRRNAYPFTNCTNCGPRFTIVQRTPYDRANTTMSAFAMCPDCAREYSEPENRRFHAEPTACSACGPRVWLETANERIVDGALEAAGRLLSDGRIVAVKGLGGFHLACDATNDTAVKTLRARKGRVSKPFALMVRDLAEAQRLCSIDDAERSLLLSVERPIVLLRRRPGGCVSESIAPANKFLGLMLPYTPLHQLLFDHSPPALVMTSGNLSEEPLTFTNASARAKLGALADAFLMHDRDIHVPCDDSVVRLLPGGDSMVARRARGFVPNAIDLPFECDCILGVGAEQKNTFCLAWGNKAVVSQHIGDLDSAETFDYFAYAIEHFYVLFGRRPRIIAHDLHPGYLSTAYALEHGNARLIGVQHHHAHIAGCLAEHGRTGKCIGVALDGTGYGTDGTIWGGELLIAGAAGFERIGRLAQVRLPGGEAAIRDPRRMALAYIYAAWPEDRDRLIDALGLGFTQLESQALERQIETGLNSPLTSSAGRLFDAVAAAIVVCRERSYEGQPAVELEMAADEQEEGFYTAPAVDADNEIIMDGPGIFRAAVRDRLEGEDVGIVAARFHNSVVEMLVSACQAARERTGLDTAALSGGVFQNALILSRLRSRLERLGFEVLTHKLVPPNDGGISLGQVAVAAAVASQENG